uniref:DH domain-containing protein n=1 Tax=Sarcophilus harrisii TaxID=9305 RepID=A0A7N4P7Q9_SARHA
MPFIDDSPSSSPRLGGQSRVGRDVLTSGTSELDVEKGLEMRRWVLSAILDSEKTYLGHLEALLLVGWLGADGAAPGGRQCQGAAPAGSWGVVPEGGRRAAGPGPDGARPGSLGAGPAAHEAPQGRGHHVPAGADGPADRDHLLQRPGALRDPQGVLRRAGPPRGALEPAAAGRGPLPEAGPPARGVPGLRGQLRGGHRDGGPVLPGQRPVCRDLGEPASPKHEGLQRSDDQKLFGNSALQARGPRDPQYPGPSRLAEAHTFQPPRPPPAAGRPEDLPELPVQHQRGDHAPEAVHDSQEGRGE